MTTQLTDEQTKTLSELNFDNTYARLPENFYKRVKPTALPAPYLISFNPSAAELLDLDPRECETDDFIETFAGNRLPSGSDPLAAVYAGHQFGQFVPQLGDGRAILLGEVLNAKGERWDVQLKGAGRTAFSRFGDGRAVLRSTIREYLCSEAMHGLGIPTSRALAIVGSDQPVRRETFETAAVLTRLATTHVRFGSFEYFYHRGLYDLVKQLADYVIDNHFTELSTLKEPRKYLEFFREVVRRTARLIARWQAVGFTHGVMNTDNMSIIGLTIDYGPFGFLDAFDAGFIPNHSDYAGRYAYDQQPAVALWNLSALAQALVKLVAREDLLEALEDYRTIFANAYAEQMRGKLGLNDAHEDDIDLISALLTRLQTNRVDYTIFFRRLSELSLDSNVHDERLSDLFINPQDFDGWAKDYRARLLLEDSVDAERSVRMNLSNPKYVLRNYMAQTAIESATEQRDYSEIDRLLKLLRRPFDEQPEMEEYAQLPPAWSAEISVSCSS